MIKRAQVFDDNKLQTGEVGYGRGQLLRCAVSKSI